MYHVEIYVRVRRACMVEGMSVREASRVLACTRDTVRKMLAYSAPPGTGAGPTLKAQACALHQSD